MRAAFWRFVSLLLLRLLRKALTAYRRASGKLAMFVYEVEHTPLDPARLADVKVFAGRSRLLDALPKGGVAVEVGTMTGAFAREILDRVKPDKLYTIDISYRVFDRSLFTAAELESGKIEMRLGLSADMLSEFEDGSIDLIYIDAAHDFENVRNDIEIAARKLRPTGAMVMNDYTAWSAAEGMPYGVIPAINAFCNRTGWVVTAIALERYGHHDVALAPPPDGPATIV